MSWHAHKIDHSFKDLTSDVSLFSPLTMTHLYLTSLTVLLLLLERCPAFQATVGFDKSTCRDLLVIRFQSVTFQPGFSVLSCWIIIGHFLNVLRALPCWCFSRRPGFEIFFLPNTLHYWGTACCQMITNTTVIWLVVIRIVWIMTFKLLH